MPNHQVFNRRQSVGGGVHHVMSGPAVEVNVDQTGSENRVAKIDDPCLRWNRHVCSSGDGGNNPIFHDERSVLNPLQRGQ